MKPEFTPQEADVAIKFLNRVDLKGSESIASATILTKLMAIRDGRELPNTVTELEPKGKAE